MTRKRTREPDRKQGLFAFEYLEDGLASDHPARVLWNVTGTLDLGGLLRNVKSVEGGAGRSTKSPRMKLVLWLYAVTCGVGSAREIARRITTDVAFRWIAGDLTVHHDTLSVFRAEQGDALDELMTDVLAVLTFKGVLALDLVAQDGMRVRASASAPSFRRMESLEECREQAALHVKAVFAAADDPEISAAQRARRREAALDFQRRVDEAIATVETLREQRDASSHRKLTDKPQRASTTDAEARIMKMPDGGFRPAYNVQLATAGSPLGGPRTIIAAQVTNVGSDMNAVPSMLDQIERRTGQLPKRLLADSNHAGHDGIRNAAERGVEAIIAVPDSRPQNKYDQRSRDPDVQGWKARMQTDEARTHYKARAGLCELTNAHLRRQRGMSQFLVRGLRKVTNVVLIAAIATNLLQHAQTLLPS